jgi:hypothetical protein
MSIIWMMPEMLIDKTDFIDYLISVRAKTFPSVRLKGNGKSAYLQGAERGSAKNPGRTV